MIHKTYNPSEASSLVEAITIPRSPFTVDWLVPPPKTLRARRLSMREEDCACAKDYTGANCTSQQAVQGLRHSA